jgi:putative tRNA adenosine deaminase-associated protein
VVAYFTAVLARTGRSWKTRDVEVDDAESLEDLAGALRTTAFDEQPVLAVVEHEDEWFALVRVDGDEEPRVFVSDMIAASHSSYAELLAPAADVDVDLEGDDASDGDEEDPAAAPRALTVWAGDPELLEDLGVSARTLRRMVEDNGEDPGSVLADVGEQVGFADQLEALR